MCHRNETQLSSEPSSDGSPAVVALLSYRKERAAGNKQLKAFRREEEQREISKPTEEHKAFSGPEPENRRSILRTKLLAAVHAFAVLLRPVHLPSTLPMASRVRRLESTIIAGLFMVVYIQPAKHVQPAKERN